ncbi:MAG: rRNA maturation RNase YbeY [Spirochaetia bacterium]|nr:rRNA maturation RNase YbeY [Spirochaetia bacterium]MCF7946344.1 rRNA maturation RNase YbeY [Spirochaetia bacterium]
MNNIVDITWNDSEYKSEYDDSIVQLVEFILEKREISNAEVSLIFVNDTYIQELNRIYRGLNEPTDVLSFSQENFTNRQTESGKITAGILGDIVISTAFIENNRKNFGVSFTEELYRMIIHGMLHLLGFEHKSYNLQEPMLEYQEKLLNVFISTLKE